MELTGLQMATGTIDRTGAGQSSWSKRITAVWLLGSLVLLPVDFVTLPFNMALADVWILAGLPFLWLSFALGHQTIGLTYAVAMLADSRRQYRQHLCRP